MTRVICNDDLHGSAIFIEGRPHSITKPSRLRFASQSMAIRVEPRVRVCGAPSKIGGQESHDAILQVSSYIRNTLRLPGQGQFNVTVRGDELALGPCLGLYATTVSNQSRLFGEQTAMFRDMVQIGNDRGVDVVVLTPGFLKSQTGWRYDGVRKTWVQQPLPMPDIVLRRSGTFRKPWTDVNAELAMLSRACKLHTLPWSVSNKWAFYRQLKGVAELKEHLPTSHFAKSGDEVWKLFTDHRDVYVKPLAGAQGVSVYRLQMHNHVPTVMWEERIDARAQKRDARTSLATRVRVRELTGESDFLNFWRQTQLRQCIVQETIDLPRTDEDCPFDFRWLIQYTDDSRVVARVARIGKPKSVTTNIHTGGQALDAKQVLHFIRGVEAEKLLSRLDKVALAVAETLRKKHGPFAELGVDLAVRQDGRVVVFEVNPTPGRRMLRSLPGSVREMSLEYLLEYAIKATGF